MRKDDHEKPDAALLLHFSGALVQVAKVCTMGSKKYTPEGWLQVPNGQHRYTSALLRHLFAEEYECNDTESNLLHAAHVAWNALARLELVLRESEKGERT